VYGSFCHDLKKKNPKSQQHLVQKFLPKFGSLTTICAKILTAIQNLSSSVCKNYYRKLSSTVWKSLTETRNLNRIVCKNSYWNSNAQQHSLKKVLPKLEILIELCVKLHTETRKLDSTVWKSLTETRNLNIIVCKNSYWNSKAQ